MDRSAGKKRSRSAFIETVLAEYLRARERAEREARDLELINAHADSGFSSVVRVPILSRGHGYSTQVFVGMNEGLKYDSWILGDNLISIRKKKLTRFLGPSRFPSSPNWTDHSRLLLT